MILSEYQAKREVLEKKIQELGDQEAEKKMELSIRHQTAMKKIASQIGNLKHQRAELNKEYEKDKSWWHQRFRDEKNKVTASIHALRMEYLTVNGAQDVRPAKLTPLPVEESSLTMEEPKDE